MGTHRNAVVKGNNPAVVVAPDAPVLHGMKHRVQIVDEHVAEVVIGVTLRQKMHICIA
jgi:hypothetical protein